MPRGWGRGWCWYYMLQGQLPKIRIGNQEITWYPGMGMGWLVWQQLLGQGNLPSTNFNINSEIDRLKKEKEELEKRLIELESRIRELERQRQ